MANHTPGPWAYAGLAGDHEFAVYAESTGRDLALVRDFNGPNARLIAAAPDLLAALENIANYTALVAGDSAERLSAMVAARAAIRKAKGE